VNVRECFEKGLLVQAHVGEETIKSTLGLASHHIGRASGNLEIGFFDVAFALAYQSMLHSARALLFGGGVKERSHVCVILYLREKYRQEPHVIKYLNILDSYRVSRHEIVYRGGEVSKEEAIRAIDDAGNFLTLVREILSGRRKEGLKSDRRHR